MCRGTQSLSGTRVEHRRCFFPGTPRFLCTHTLPCVPGRGALPRLQLSGQTVPFHFIRAAAISPNFSAQLRILTLPRP